jgi:hypothetical protein
MKFFHMEIVVIRRSDMHFFKLELINLPIE